MPIYEYVSPPLYEKIRLVWTAPYTKFWMNFLSYLLFLGLFSLVTLWPACGNLVLDSILWLWTATIAIEETRVTYKSYLTGSQLPITVKVLEIGIMIFFLILFFIIRIIGSWDGQLLGVDRIFASKVLLCFYLLYFYYRTVFTFLPISNQLGPMLVSMKMMIKNDFMTYLRLLIIFTTACGIALNAIIYPFHPIDPEFIKKTFLFRGILQIFVLDKDELETPSKDCIASGLSNHINQTYQCADLTDGIDFSYSSTRLNQYGVNYKCVQPSLYSWFIFIQYFFLIKLFLPTILTAMFANSILKVEQEAEQLWQFQRFEIVVEYEKRLPFGPPFTVFFYFFLMIRNFWNRLIKFSDQCKVCCQCFCLKHKKTIIETGRPKENVIDNQKSIFVQNGAGQFGRPGVFNYWRNLAQKYSHNLEKSDTEKWKLKKIDMTMIKLRMDMNTQKKSMMRLNDRVIGLEQSIQSNQGYLEQIMNVLSQKDAKKGLIDRKLTTYIHILSRESPYLNTNIPRFFINNKLVPWECNIDLYDPPFISFPPEYFKIDAIFIDEELGSDERYSLTPYTLPPSTPALENGDSLSVTRISQTDKTASHTEPGTPNLSRFSVQKAPSLSSKTSLNSKLPKTRRTSQVSQKSFQNRSFLWNSLDTIDDQRYPGQNKKITIDRKSWITKIDEATSNVYPFIYSLDGIGYPKNPIGRTGVRGRGALSRYGPNKEIMAIVTRWKRMNNRPIYIDRRKLLEFIAVKDTITGLSIIPGDKILGDESKYSVVCRTFMKIVFEEFDVEKGQNFVLEDMTKFFCSFASKNLVNYSKSIPPYTDVFDDLGFFPTMIYSGYIDDQRNTDNAWIEAEVWNFHYDKEDYFNSKIKDPESKWREVSSNVRITSNEIITDALKDISEIHNGFYN